ncbi:MAG: histidine ammonia-lyase [Bdellovibrionaceae bacterium]|nr:histidine ammonia-lyase [Pseudobdellovibrionaceae bacterium]
MHVIAVTGSGLTMELAWEVAYGEGRVRVELDAAARSRMAESRAYIDGRMMSGEAIYGVNTGFGAFSSVRISPSEIIQLQKNLIRSHSVGVGEPFTPAQTRAIMYLRANALATGKSGIRPLVVDKILEFLNAGIAPVIPQQGSVGASGDLAPLSHLALALIGEGDVWKDGQQVPVAGVLKEKNIEPLELQAKEGLSLINGCQVMTAVGLLNGYEARRLAWMADLAGAMTLESIRGTRSAFDPLIAATRPHPGEAKTARNLMKILGESSPISESHVDCNRVQDAYSLRCMPAVHGATKDALRHGIQVLEIEANSSTDNPLVFAENGKILSCGNFHGEPVAFQLDFMAIALSAMASMSECRVEKLINPAMSGLPAFLAPQGGLNSGHMIVQVAAAALVSENKILSHPASVDSIPTSADKEDHVSMGTIASRKFGQIVRNAENIVAMEILSASQALDLLKPLQPSGAVKAAYDVVRKEVPFADVDRVFARDIEAIKYMIRDERLLRAATSSGSLEW